MSREISIKTFCLYCHSICQLPELMITQLTFSHMCIDLTSKFQISNFIEKSDLERDQEKMAHTISKLRTIVTIQIQLMARV